MIKYIKDMIMCMCNVHTKIQKYKYYKKTKRQNDKMMEQRNRTTERWNLYIHIQSYK